MNHRIRLDNKTTSMMVEDLLFNPLLAAKILLRVKIPAHEELRILQLWTTYYTNDDSGFSTGKSWTFALISALRSILLRNRVSGVISKTFAQGKLIFSNYDRWYNSSSIFRSCLKHIGSKPRLIHATDVWSAHFRGGSEIRVLPPNFLGDAERIRSERWSDAYLDEWTTYSNFKALNTTIIGRVTATNYFADCPVRQNHVHLASTPSYTHHPAYKMVKKLDHQIAIGNKDYARFSCNYRHIQDTQEWKWLVSRKTIFHMQTNLPKGIVKSEVDGVWQSDSGAYYNSVLIERSRLNIIPLLTCRTSSHEIFIAGIDVARGGSDQTSANQGDDFALTVWRMTVTEQRAYPVLVVRKSKITDNQMSAIVHKYHRRFNFNFVVYDPGGGGLFVKDKLRLENQTIDNEDMLCTPIISVTDNTGVIGDQILVSFARADHYVSLFYGKMLSDSVLVNRLHKDFKSALENKKAFLPGVWNGWENTEAEWDVGAKREWLNRNTNFDEKEVFKAEMDLAVGQLGLVDYMRDNEGNAIIDSHGMYKFKSKEKKDAAYSMIYGYFGVMLFLYLQQSGMIEDVNSDNEEGELYAMEEI